MYKVLHFTTVLIHFDYHGDASLIITSCSVLLFISLQIVMITNEDHEGQEMHSEMRELLKIHVILVMNRMND